MWNKILKNKFVIINPKKKSIKLSIKKDQRSVAQLNKKVDDYEKQIIECRNFTSMIENKILILNKLKGSCTTCQQKVTNQYKKKQIGLLEKKKKESLIQMNGWISLSSVNEQRAFEISESGYRSFEESKKYVHSLNLKSQREWEEYCKLFTKKRPKDIPTSPDVVYGPNFDPNTKEKWIGWGDWLGTGTIKKYRNFKEAREFAHKSKIKSMLEWKKLSAAGMLPADIPKNPERVYKKQWKGYHEMFAKRIDHDNSVSKKVKLRKSNN